ncbi:MAG: GTP pyrophosphokinase, partial [Prevotellaceae bacterium]|nr:GTP pyrophosphokinase [Prevotellaceae bacterium]
ATWNMRGEMSFMTRIAMKGIDRKGMVKDVTVMLSDLFDVNIHRITANTEDGVFSAEIELKVRDNSNLGDIISQLETINGMQKVYRI